MHVKLADKFPSSKQFLKILKSDYNKSKIQNFVKSSLSRRSQAECVRVIYVLEKSIGLVDGSDIPDLSCQQVEANTMMFFYLYTT